MRDVVDRIGLLLRAEERRAAAELGIQPVQLQVLAYVGRCNRFSDNPAAVAEYLGATKGTISQSIQRLQEKDLLVSERDEYDRRRVHLSLTAAGRALLRAQAEADRLDGALARLRRRAGARGVLDEFLSSLQGVQEQLSFGHCRTCRHFQQQGRSFSCLLFDERLLRDDLDRICREHEPR